MENLCKNLSVVTKEVQKSQAVTKGNIVNFYYQWRIENFSFSYEGVDKTTINSPAFSMRTDFSKEYQWHLSLNFVNNDGLKLDPNLVLETNNDKINTKYTFGILDGNKEFFPKGPFQDSFNSDMQDVPDYWFLSEINEILVKQNDTLVIFCKGESNIPSSYTEKDPELSNLKSLNPTIQYKDLDRAMLQEILHFVYTGKTPNTKLLHNSLLTAFDNLELTQLLEENLFSKLNIEAAAEIYKFMYSHKKPDLIKKTIKFIKQNALRVMATEGWKSIMVSPDPNMLTKIISSFANDLTTETTKTEETNVMKDYD